jgi:hypothetical protein
MVASFATSANYVRPVAQAVGKIPLSGFAAGNEPLIEPRLAGTARRSEPLALQGMPLKSVCEDLPVSNTNVAVEEAPSSKSPWKPPQFELHLPVPDFARFLSPKLGEKVSHTYQRIRHRMSPTKRLRRTKKHQASITPGSKSATTPAPPDTKDGKTTSNFPVPPHPRTPAPLRNRKEEGLVKWCEEAGLDSIEGLHEALLSEVEDLDQLRDLVSTSWDTLMEALGPLGLKGIRLKKVHSALGSLAQEAKAFERTIEGEGAFTYREGVLERALIAPIDLDTSITHEAAQLHAMPPPRRPKIGDLRRPANPFPTKASELPRAAAPPAHNKYVREAKARTNAALEGSVDAKDQSEAMKKAIHNGEGKREHWGSPRTAHGHRMREHDLRAQDRISRIHTACCAMHAPLLPLPSYVSCTILLVHSSRAQAQLAAARIVGSKGTRRLGSDVRGWE